MEMQTEEQVQLAVAEGQEEQRASSIFSKAKYPITLKFEDLVYKIKTKGGKKQGHKVILKGISGVVQPGELLAMLGPSGSGKTTLLTLLGGRGSRGIGHLTGSITYNGKPFSNSLKRNMGFVTQDDVLYAHLTVTETLVYTALLRLPSTLPRTAKVEQAEAVMQQLGLVACRNSIIGGPLVRGVSGGERKRVSIGQEMLINPSLIFLDEPTSGLDSTIAGRIVSTLWDLTKGGKTVVMTIHQPSSRLFYMFHKVILLSDGNPIYFGKGSAAMDYFARIGYAPNVAMNPADFLLDLANGVFNDEASEDRTSTKEALVSAYGQHLRGQLSEELTGITKQLKETASDKVTAQWCTTWWQQFRVLLERDLKERKHESFSGLKLAQVIAVALLAGFLWFGSRGSAQEQVGLIFFVAGFWSFYPVFQAIFTFPQERTMLTKERSSGMYRLSSYFAARLVGDLPMELVLPIIFVTITYWMGGLKPNAASFFANLGVLLLSVLVAQGLGLAIGALVLDLKAATTLASVLLLSFMLTGGYYVQNVPAFIGWIKYLSLNYYTFKLQLQAQFDKDETYQCSPTTRCLVRDLATVKVVGFDYQTISVVALFLMLIFFRLIAYIGLMRIGVTRKLR